MGLKNSRCARLNSGLFPPWLMSSDKSELWVSTSQAALWFGRTSRTILNWCKNGTLVEAKFRVWRDLKGIFWICPPPEHVREFRKLAVRERIEAAPRK